VPQNVSNPQTKICKKKSILIKKAPKQATRKSSKKTANPKKKQAQIRGKTARLATLLQKFKGAFFLYCELYIGNIV